MDDNAQTIENQIALLKQVEWRGLYDRLCQLEDKRKRRGRRYPLALVLLLVVLAKLCGENEVRGIAEWVRLRKSWWREALDVTLTRFPHWTTYSRILSTAVDIEAFETLVGQFFQQCSANNEALALDGKTLRGTITPVQTGVHLVSVYAVETGAVVRQVAVADKSNEIVAASGVLDTLPLAGRVVTGDAMFTQRALSEQIVQAGGDYLWIVKDNQPGLRAAIERLFAPERCLPGHSRLRTDFQTVHTTDKQHGRLEQRCLTSSGLLNDYSDWPSLAQVFRLERRVVQRRSGEVRREVIYGITSLSRQQATAQRLLLLSRQHWHIENRSHYVRDVTLQEDACRLHSRLAQRALAVVNNLVVGLSRMAGFSSLPSARRFWSAHVSLALALLL